MANSVLLFATSNVDTSQYLPRGIKIQKFGDGDSWDETTLVGSNPYAWVTRYDKLLPNTSYNYQAYVTKDEETILWGDVEAFTNPTSLKNCLFVYNAIPEEGGDVLGTIDGETVPSATIIDYDPENEHNWGVVATPKENYNLIRFDVYESEPYTIIPSNDDPGPYPIEGTIQSDVVVTAIFSEKNPDQPLPGYTNLKVKVVLNGNTHNVIENIQEYVSIDGLGQTITIGNPWTFTATPMPGYEVLGWSYDLSYIEVMNETINFDVEANMTLYVWVNSTDIFVLDAYSSPGSVANMIIDGIQTNHKSYSKAHSNPIVVTFNKINPNYEFKDWRLNNVVSDITSETYNYYLSEFPNATSAHLVAEFELKAPSSDIIIKISATEGGYIYDGDDGAYVQEYANGKSVIAPWALDRNLGAIVNSGYYFEEWALNGNRLTGETVLTPEIMGSRNENCNIVAKFKKQTFTLTFETDTTGVNCIPTSTTAAYNTSFGLANFPTNLTDPSYLVDYWEDENGNTITSPITITSDRTFTAHLKVKPTFKFKHETQDWNSDTWHNAFNDVEDCKDYVLSIPGETPDPAWEGGSESQNSTLVYIPGIYSYDENEYIYTYIKVPEGYNFEVYDWGSNGWKISTDNFEAVSGENNVYILTRSTDRIAKYGIKITE